MKRHTLLLALFLVIGVTLRAVDVWRPIDSSTLSLSTIWRETDVGAIARNFYLEENNILYPRVDWRGDNEGYVESEFPLYPWLVAQSYFVFGYHEELARVWSLLFSLVAFATLSAVAFRLLAPPGALFAVLFFAVSPLLVHLATAVQPEPLMFAFIALSLYAYVRHRENDSRKWLLYASVFLSLAALCKPPALVYGLVFFIDTLARKKSASVLRSPTHWLALIIIFAPSVIWFAHSHEIFLQYGHSLGVSNKSHWIGKDILFDFDFYKGEVINTATFVTSYPGLGLALIGLFIVRKSAISTFIYSWLAALLVFYITTMWDTGMPWAFYYHVYSVPFAGIVFGATLDEVVSHRGRDIRNRWLLGLGGTVAFGVGFAITLLHNISPIWSFTAGVLCFAGYYYLVTAGARIAEDKTLSAPGAPPFRWASLRLPWVSAVALALAPAAIAATALRSVLILPHAQIEESWYTCAKQFSEEINGLTDDGPNSRIVCWGGAELRRPGRPSAYNAAFMFFWTRHKGFSLPENRNSISALDSLRQLGARYYIEFAPRSDSAYQQQLHDTYPILDSCGDHRLWALTPQNAIHSR